MDFGKLSIREDIQFKLIELSAGETLDMSGNKITTIVAGKVKDRLKGNLNTFKSSVYHNDSIVAETDSLITVFDIKDPDVIYDEINVDDTFGEYCRTHWTQLRGLYDVEGFEKVDLYRGDQIEKQFEGTKYKFNLWFCGPKIDCLWHNQHDFIETHTNIAGRGFMQKSSDDTELGLIETVGLMPGSSHRTFNIDEEYEDNGNPKYPFHRWLGGKTGSIWFVIEKY